MAKTRADLAAAQEKVTAFDEFDLTIPRETFPPTGMAARAAQGIVNSFAWRDANPMLSFVTTYAEPEAVEVARAHMYKNYIDHDMYPQTFGHPAPAPRPRSVGPEMLTPDRAM